MMLHHHQTHIANKSQHSEACWHGEDGNWSLASHKTTIHRTCTNFGDKLGPLSRVGASMQFGLVAKPSRSPIIERIVSRRALYGKRAGTQAMHATSSRASVLTARTQMSRASLAPLARPTAKRTDLTTCRSARRCWGRHRSHPSSSRCLLTTSCAPAPAPAPIVVPAVHVSLPPFSPAAVAGPCRSSGQSSLTASAPRRAGARARAPPCASARNE